MSRLLFQLSLRIWMGTLAWQQLLGFSTACLWFLGVVRLQSSLQQLAVASSICGFRIDASAHSVAGAVGCRRLVLVCGKVQGGFRSHGFENRPRLGSTRSAPTLWFWTRHMLGRVAQAIRSRLLSGRFLYMALAFYSGSLLAPLGRLRLLFRTTASLRCSP